MRKKMGKSAPHEVTLYHTEGSRQQARAETPHQSSSRVDEGIPGSW